MATGGDKGSFVAVTVAKRELRTDTIVVTRDVEQAKFLVLKESGGDVIIELPVNVAEDVGAWSVLFRCVDKKKNKVRYPTIEEIQPIFQEYWDELEYASHGEHYGTVEYCL